VVTEGRRGGRLLAPEADADVNLDVLAADGDRGVGAGDYGGDAAYGVVDASEGENDLKSVVSIGESGGLSGKLTVENQADEGKYNNKNYTRRLKNPCDRLAGCVRKGLDV
jgi:hypothetical protein